MSKRVEEAALKAYPSDVYSGGKSCRRAYKEGYEQAEKETIERAVKWLEEHADEYNGSESVYDHMEEEMVADFRKAMEEE